jgi:hypothetical protein
MLLRLASFSRDNMLRKVIWNKEKLSIVLRFAQMLVDVIQFFGRKMCTQLREKFTKYEL